MLGNIQVELPRLLGEQLVAVYLYGSHARGDAHPGSDIDVFIILQGEFDYFQMLEKTSELFWRLSIQNDVVISRVFVSEENFSQPNSPFLVNVRREAVPV